MLLLHGALGAQSQFDALRPLLRGHDLITVDFEGHGERMHAGRPFRLMHFVENALARLDEESAAPIPVFGYSMGGYVALLLAALHPDRVSHVFTLGTMLEWSPEIAAREVSQLDARSIREKVPRFAAVLAERHAASGWERVVNDTAEMLTELGSHPPITSDVLARIACPVRLAVGDRDATVTLEETRAAMGAIPHGEMEVLPRTAHPFERAPMQRLAWSIEEFVAGRLASRG
jgi:pimeloyl-ACP methyl ester carboxylesterase